MARTVNSALEKARRAQDAKTLARQLVPPPPAKVAPHCPYCGVAVKPGARACAAHTDLADAEARAIPPTIPPGGAL